MDHILIVEDDINIRETLQEIFELSGYKVSTATNGRLGYDAIMKDCPDLVICDVAMPELDGFELLWELQLIWTTEVIPPFLFVTAKVDTLDLQKGMNLGAADYIFKPFDHTDILRSVRLLLDKKR
jgi:DNA-binding response OmpR family regulator